MYFFVFFQIFYFDLIDKIDILEYILVSYFFFFRIYNYFEKRLFFILDINVYVGYKKIFDIMEKNYLLEKLMFNF